MSTHAQAALDEKSSACIARQPILTANEQVVGYELLLRETPDENPLSFVAGGATSATIDTLSVVGFDVLCDGGLAFIDFTREMLLDEWFALLPPGRVVVEIQATIPPDAGVTATCQRLKERGYSMALDDFVSNDPREPLLAWADFIKVDIKKVMPQEAAALVSHYASKQVQMVAQKVETRQDHVTATKNRFTHFQGYFFRHPEQMRARHIPANRASHLRLLQAVAKPEADFLEIEDLVKRDPSLCYRLLRYLNSPLLGMAAPVQSVRHALTLLGEKELARWIRMAATLALSQDKSSDLILASLVRARFCELIAAKVKHGNSDLFLMGILSLMDAILEVPIGVVIEELSLDPETEAQLLCGKTGRKTILSPIYDLMVAREAGDWEAVTKLGKQLDLSLSQINKTYNEGMRWAHEITSAVGPQPPQPPASASLKRLRGNDPRPGNS